MAKAAGGAKASQSAKSFPQALYDTLTRTSAAQWDTVLRHPWFLRPVSLYINGLLTVMERTRALMGLGLRMMNVPTREEIAALDHKLTALHDRLDDLTAHLTDAAASPKRAARATVARKTSSAKEIAGRKERLSPGAKPASPSSRKRAARRVVEAASATETTSTSDAPSSSS